MRIIDYQEFSATKNENGTYFVRIVANLEANDGSKHKGTIEIPKADITELIRLGAMEGSDEAEKMFSIAVIGD